MSRVPYHGVAGQAETVGELAQVIAGRLPLLASTALLAGAGGTPSGGRAGRDDADGKPVALGEDPPVRRGDLSPVEQDAAGPLPLPGLRDGDFQLQAQVDLVERDADVPGANPGGAVSADDDAGGDGIAAREPTVAFWRTCAPAASARSSSAASNSSRMTIVSSGLVSVRVNS
jgi:hypothetical protein